MAWRTEIRLLAGTQTHQATFDFWASSHLLRELPLIFFLSAGETRILKLSPSKKNSGEVKNERNVISTFFPYVFIVRCLDIGAILNMYYKAGIAQSV